MQRHLVLALALAFAGCDVDDDAPDIKAELEVLDGVTVIEWIPPENFQTDIEARYFDLYFTQPIDHDNPNAGTFQQYVAMIHIDPARPLVAYTSGYGAGWRRYRSEPASLIDGNQISIEYRFYSSSRPENPDWSKLTVQQNVEDEHAIYQALDAVYSGATIQTGGSKGGENSMFHLWLYPEDLDGVVSYVAPVITDFPDQRYATVLDDIGTAACRDALRAIQREMLVRRTAMETRAAQDSAYAIAGVAHATETAIVELEFSFWMTRGEGDCDEVPLTTATDDALYTFLAETGTPAAYGDDDLIAYGQQYLYQDHLELGYPVWQHAHLDDLMLFSYEDWSAYLPAPVPAYDPTAARGLADWLATGPDRLIFIGGEWDPWGAGYPVIPTDSETIVISVVHGTHWSASFGTAMPTEQMQAVMALRRWAGVSGPSPALAARQSGMGEPHLVD